MYSVSKFAAGWTVEYTFFKMFYQRVLYLTITLRARVFYEQIVNEAQPSWLSLVENESE